MLVGIDHVQLAIPAGNEALALAVSFYVDVLGLERVEKPAALAARGGAWFRSPHGVSIHLGVEEPFAPARKAHPAFIVDDLDALCDAVRAAGGDVRPADDVPGVRRVHIDDPFGNRVELLEEAT